MEQIFKSVEEYLTLSAEDDAGVSQDVLCEETAETQGLLRILSRLLSI